MQKNEGRSLMIVDDERSIRRGISTLIPWQDCGIESVRTADSGACAIRQMEQHCPDIVVTDIRMPGMDGLELIRATKEKGLRPQFIIISGHDDFKYAQQAMGLGVRRYLLKPVQIDELTAAVQDLCNELSTDAASPEREVQAEERLLVQLLCSQGGRTAHNCGGLKKIAAACDEVRIAALDFVPSDADMGDIRTILEESFGGVHLARCEGITAAVLPSLPDWRKRLQGCLSRMSQWAEEPLSAGIGAAVPILRDWHLSFRHAGEALEYRLYDLDGGIYEADALFSACAAVPPPRNPNSSALLDAIVTGDGAALDAALEEFVRWLFYIPAPPPAFVKGMCIYLVLDIEKKLVPYSKKPFPSQLPGEELGRMHRFSEIRTWMRRLFLDCMTQVRQDGVFKFDPLVEAAKQYIDEHIHGKLLLSEVAAHVHLSENYFASLFRDYVGRTFRDYVLELKISRAKDMIVLEHRSIAEVSEILGYEDYRSFHRAFKKQTGKNPSEWCAHPQARRQGA